MDSLLACGEGLADAFADYQKTIERLKWCVKREMWRAAESLLAQIRGDARNVASWSDRVADSAIRVEPVPTPPSLREIYNDLESLEDEFARVAIETTTCRRQAPRYTLVATTDDIILEERNLGPFQIRMDLSRIRPSGRFDYHVKALQPNCAASRGDVPHPHVSDSTVLCEGDAVAPLTKAMLQGRLLDACLIIKNVLETYNKDSPHVALNAWEDVDDDEDEDTSCCSDCGDRYDNDDMTHCQGCDQYYCGGCIHTCDQCERTRCNGCVTECEGCENHMCTRCEGTCRLCDKPHCEDCLSCCDECSKAVCDNCRHSCNKCGRTRCKDCHSDGELCPACREKEVLNGTDESDTPEPSTADTAESGGPGLFDTVDSPGDPASPTDGAPGAPDPLPAEDAADRPGQAGTGPEPVPVHRVDQPPAEAA